MHKDVFVIGAGASVPYGLPTGFDLLQTIKSIDFKKLPNPLLEQFFLKLIGYSVNIAQNPKRKVQLFDKVAKEILIPVQNSCILSIDQFLKNHLDNDNIQFVLKSILSFIILSSENVAYNNRFNPKAQTENHLGNIDWIQHLISRIDLECNNNDDLISFFDNTTFISFNYDRILEFFLYSFLKHDRLLTGLEAQQTIDKMKIFHINGYLGGLDIIPFGVNNVKYDTVINTMRTVWEAPADEDLSTFEYAKSLVHSADRVFILGTSYIPDNNKSIGLDDLPLESNIYGTAFGLSEANIGRVLNFFNSKDREYHSKGECKIKNISAKDLIIDEYILDRK